MISQDYIYNIGQLFSQLAEKYPQKVVIQYPQGQSYTYGDVDQLSKKYIAFFQQEGLVKGDVIAILNQKSIDSFGMMLAALQMGVIYTNLDPFSPVDRLNKMVQRCKPKLLVVDNLGESKIDFSSSSEGVKTVYLDQLKALNFSFEKNDELNAVVGSDPAYIMFTSGSTGFPKGALMSHSNVLNLIQWAKTTFQIQETDKFTGVNPIYFDNSVFDFYSSIFNAAVYVPFSVEQVKNPKKLVELIDQSECTNWFSVPSMLIYLLATKTLSVGKFKSIKSIAFGGEGFPKKQLQKLFNLFNATAKLVNVYGPTECTCICSSLIIEEKVFEDMNSFSPLGKIAPNFSFYIDPINENEPNEGELCLLGPNVGLGYYNDSERTAKAFVQHPNKDYSCTMYKTGDLVYLDNDGFLQIKGRVDHQIKHLGYRIELEEIESGMNRVDNVKESAAIYKTLGNGLGYIVGIVAVETEIDTNDFKNRLKAYLPDYMIPKEVKTMSFLPKNQNGKIDRVALKDII